MNPFKERIAQALAPIVNAEPQAVVARLERPPDPAMGDYAYPCFLLAKERRKAPPAIAKDLATSFPAVDGIGEARPVGPYLNFRLDTPSLAEHVVGEVLSRREQYASGGRTGRIVVDFSSPNIAKPFHIGHLRSTVLGHALARIHAHLGYEVVRINHLGDWGTQFGLQIYAYQHWGDDAKLAADPIGHLVEVYVRANEEAAGAPAVKDEARALFKRLEQGDPTVTALWQKFRDVSLERFKKVYGVLGIDFDRYDGESFYRDKMESAVARVTAKGLAIESEGALVVPLDALKLPPAILRKSDDASIYFTRDLAAAFFRLETFDPVKILYVVGTPQSDHFRALFAVLCKTDPTLEPRLLHVPFGQYRFADRAMSTRRGDVVALEDVIEQGLGLARKVIEEKNPQLEDKETVARKVAVGALIFGDLSTDRIKDIVFDWNKVLDFDGDTGPYVQNAFVRTRGIFRKLATEGLTFDPASVNGRLLTDPMEHRQLMHLLELRSVIEMSADTCKPHLLAGSLLSMARDFHRFFHELPVLKASPPEGLREARLGLVEAVGLALGRGLWLLGIDAPERM